MKMTIELEDSMIFFDDKRYDRVVFVTRFEKPLELPLDQFIDILEREAQRRKENKELAKQK